MSGLHLKSVSISALIWDLLMVLRKKKAPIEKSSFIMRLKTHGNMLGNDGSNSLIILMERRVSAGLKSNGIEAIDFKN